MPAAALGQLELGLGVLRLQLQSLVAGLFQSPAELRLDRAPSLGDEQPYQRADGKFIVLAWGLRLDRPFDVRRRQLVMLNSPLPPRKHLHAAS
jgi:hypothetical protein